MAILLVVVLAACGSVPDETPTPVPRESPDAEDLANSRQAVPAFLELMADPDLTYRVTGEVRAGPEDPEGGPALMVTSRYDVRGDDYGGQLRVRVLELKFGREFML